MKCVESEDEGRREDGRRRERGRVRTGTDLVVSRTQEADTSHGGREADHLPLRQCSPCPMSEFRRRRVKNMPVILRGAACKLEGDMVVGCKHADARKR